MTLKKSKMMARDLATEAMEILLLVHNMQFKTKNYNAKTQQTIIEVLKKKYDLIRLNIITDTTV